MATLLIVPENPPLIVLSMSCQGVFKAIAKIMAEIRIPIAALTLHLDIINIINIITNANTHNT